MNEYKKYDYIQVHLEFKNNVLQKTTLRLINKERYQVATCKETLNFFKEFGTSYCKHFDGYTKAYAKNKNLNAHVEYYFFEDVATLVNVLGWTIEPFNNHKDTFILRDKGFIERGLIHHETVVCLFRPCIGLYIPTWYSNTTTRRIQEYVNRHSNVLNQKYIINKKSIENGLHCYFKKEYC